MTPPYVVRVFDRSGTSSIEQSFTHFQDALAWIRSNRYRYDSQFYVPVLTNDDRIDLHFDGLTDEEREQFDEALEGDSHDIPGMVQGVGEGDAVGGSAQSEQTPQRGDHRGDLDRGDAVPGVLPPGAVRAVDPGGEPAGGGRQLVATPEIMLEQALLISIEAVKFARTKPNAVLASHWYRQGARLYREAADFLDRAAAKVEAQVGT